MRLKLIPLLAIALIIFSVSLALVIGEIGFEGDDWWQFSWPYWYPFPQSIWEYAKESRRPIEGIYTVLGACCVTLYLFSELRYTTIS